MKAFLTKLGLLTILLLSVAWLCRVPDWEPLIAVVSALCVYLGLDAWQTFFQLSEHDQELLKRFESLLPSDSDSIRFLRDHDVGTPFYFSVRENLWRFIEDWNSASMQFDDRALEKARQNLYEKLHKFMWELATHTWPSDVNPDIATMGLNDLEECPEKWKIRRELNTCGTEAYALHQEIIKIARRKKRGLSKK